MRALIQKVDKAQVEIGAEIASSINKGFLIFLGVGQEDEKAQAEKLWNKISKLRIFEDEEGKTNLNLQAVDGEILIVSQFTLWANCKKGNRPSFTDAAPADKGKELYEYFVSLAKKDYEVVETGEFGADMKVSLVNNGPFTIWLDTDSL